MTERRKHVLEEPVASTIISHRFSHVVWGAIFAGVVTVLVLQALLALLGAGLGMTTLELTEGNNAKTIGAGAVIWWLISGTIAFYVGGVIAGRMAGIPRNSDGMIHGFLTWGVTSIVMFFLLTTTMGTLIAGSINALKSGGQAVAAVAPQVADQAKQMMPDNIPVVSQITDDMQQLQQRVQDPQVFQQQILPALEAIRNNPDPNAQKEQAVTVLTQNTNMSEAEARSTVDRMAQTTQQVQQKTQEVAQKATAGAETASKAAGTAALASFAMMALGALAASFGGSKGAPHWSEQEIA